MFRCIRYLGLWVVLIAVAGAASSSHAFQTKAKETQTKAKETQSKGKETQPTAEGMAESVIFISGTREGLAQVRRNGVERGRTTRTAVDGKTEEASYERRFIRGEAMTKDRIRLDQKMPTAEYAIIYNEGKIWGIINESVFTPRQATTQDFLAQQVHGVDALLRYKENGSTLSYIGKEKEMGVDRHVLDVTDKEKRRTRFYISAKTGRVLSLQYEEPLEPGGGPVKYLRKFYDYRIAQGTLVPYRTVLYRDGKQIEESRILTVTYGSKLDESLFLNPEAPAPTTTAARP